MRVIQEIGLILCLDEIYNRVAKNNQPPHMLYILLRHKSEKGEMRPFLKISCIPARYLL